MENNYTEDCTIHQDCNPGLFWNSTKNWDFVGKEGETWSANTICEFGTLCMNGICTRFGNQITGRQFYIPGVVKGLPRDIVSNVISRLWSSFWAEITGNKTADNHYTIFECTDGRLLDCSVMYP